ncbi:MAG: tRNA (adenosine(37)-N6)-dimethylallyltransferase MiaA [Treponema sp.]|nr:tRNA (adenosine(37)-N6)-dimethylallyltransferase MiaA [Treponema sp.]
MQGGNERYNTVILLGPTAVGKTALGVRIARHFGWDIISADSRQVYEGLDLGSGKDLDEYKAGGDEIQVHLIDRATLAQEYNVFKFQQDFYSLFDSMTAAGKMPFVVGGTGMYVDAVARGYDFMPVPRNDALRMELEGAPLESLAGMLLDLRPDLHNRSDLTDRERALRAIEIALYMRSPECGRARGEVPPRPRINCFIMGTTLPRETLRSNIDKRLRERMEQGMIQEVEGLHAQGFSWERLEKLGLEYRFISLFLEGKISSVEEMRERLYHAICQFAKRQETWFRGMEKKGAAIHWLPCTQDKDARFNAALELIEKNVL